MILKRSCRPQSINMHPISRTGTPYNPETHIKYAILSPFMQESLPVVLLRLFPPIKNLFRISTIKDLKKGVQPAHYFEKILGMINL